jgi:hypothetical protein
VTLAADLILLAIDARRRNLRVTEKLDYALMGADLVELAIAERVVMDGDYVLVVNARPTGDPLLDDALASIAAAKRPPTARAWVRSVRRGLRSEHLLALADKGSIELSPRAFLRFFTVTDIIVLDTERQASIRARIDAIAASALSDDPRERALAGLTYACGLASVLYPGGANRVARKRLEQAARTERVSSRASRATQTVGQAAVDATARAVTESAITAATDAAVHAAMSAAVDAAHHAGHSGHDGGAGGGGHH